ncbi:MAG: gliding motility-associated C-terminal domain-containing protein, partial [Bacteroidetes bacterium]|nr:gliding motility-associated C-terminal domain-containing protein [Bacteroidota bacterium]
TILVGYKPMPAVALGNDTAICTGQTLLLNAAVPGATYLWQDASTAATFTVTAQGSYHVAVNLNGCTAQDTVQVAVHPSPTVNIGPDQTICPGTSATFNATTAGATYLWSDGSTGPMLTTALPGTFSVLVTTGGCSTADTATVALFNLQTVNLGPDLSLCAGTTARIGATVPGATYLWNTGAATDSITVNAPGTYWLQVQLNGCIASDTVQVTIKPLPNFSLGPDRQVCPGGSTLLDAAIAGGAYLWSNGATSASITASTGTWSVAVTVNGCTASSQVSVTELQPPLVNLGADTALCPGETITLDAAQPGCSYLWNTGQTSPQITVATALTAAVTVTDAHGCQGIGQVAISYAQPGNLNLGPDTAFCAGSTVTLNATMPGATAYLWNNGSTGPSLTTGTAGTYWARATVGNCTVGDTILLASVPAPAITLGNDTTLCPGETLLLQVPSTGLSVDWQDGTHGNSVLVTAPGQYGAIVHNAAGCASTATIHVSYLAPHALSLGADTAICSGGSLQLNAGLPGGTTQWSGASQANTPSITVSGAGTYIATTTVTGCAVTDSIHITVHPLPVVALGPDTVMCEGSTLLLSATGQNLLWDNGSTNPNRVILHGGTYHVQASENGCSATDSITVEEHPVPVVSLPPDTSLCAGQLLNVNVALQGGTYAWNDGSTIPQRSLSPGTWHVRVMKAGCSASDTIHIAALPSPMLQLPQDTTLCAGQTWPINVDQPNSTFLWSTGNTLPLQLVQAPGTYGITVDREGCSASAWVNVEVVNLSSFSLGPDTLLCPGTSVQINADVPGTTVLWQDGSTALHRTVSAAGTYHATITAGGCSAASSIQVGVVDLPPVDLGADQVHCAGDTVHLHVAPGAAQVAWSNGSNGDEVQATSSGTWSVQLSLHGCHASDAVHISFLPVIDQLHLGPDRAYCAEQPLVLDATIPGASYSWNDGSQLATLAVHHPGIYWVHASGPCIQAADTVVIREGPCTPEVHVPNAFTPDGDGINDRFLPVVSEPVRHWSFMIFNRWGQQVFSSEDPGQGWDGMFGGQDAPVGIYTWDLHYTTVAPVGVIQERLRGSVALIR